MAAQDVPSAPGIVEPEAPSSVALKADREMAATSHRADGRQDHFEASRTTSVEDEKVHGDKHTAESTALDKHTADPTADKPVERSATQMSQDQYLKPREMAFVLLGMLLFVFLVSLDQTILGTATPQITNQFNSPTDIGWYTSAYLMTSTALQPLYGRMYSSFSLKWTYISSLVFFEIGSLICAVAPSSKVFIVGRAIAGLGVAGGYIGTLIIISTSAPIEKRALYSGFVGMIYGVAAIAGPLIGGALTSNVSWRWCFWINLPIAAPVLVIMLFFFHPVKRVSDMTVKQRLIRIDWAGTVLMLGSIVMLLLVLQDGGVTYDWSSGHAIGLIVGAVLAQLAFWGLQTRLGDNATIPTRMLKNRTISLGMMTNFAIGAAFFTNIAFVPIWMQAIPGASAINSGVRTLPLICSLIIFVSLVGALLPRLGYITPILVFCCALGSIGSGLFTTWTPTTRYNHWIPYQVLFGAGAGGAWQLPYLAAQTVLRGRDVELGSTAVIFTQTLGGCIMASVAQAIYSNLTLKALANIDGIVPLQVFGAGASGWRQVVPAAVFPQVLEAFNHGIVSTFYAGAVVFAIGAVTAAFIPLKRFQNAPGAAPAMA